MVGGLPIREGQTAKIPPRVRRSTFKLHVVRARILFLWPEAAVEPNQTREEKDFLFFRFLWSY